MTSGGRGRGRGRGRGIVGATESPVKARRNQRSTTEHDDGVPHIFKEMLSEDAALQFDDRPLKRRKISRTAPQPEVLRESASAVHDNKRDGGSSISTGLKQQTITDVSESSESEVEWEDVGFNDNVVSSPIETTHHEPSETLSITINTRETPSKRSKTKKRPISASEKAMRLNVHKMHVTYLLYHGFYRNNWCNDRKTQVCAIPYLASSRSDICASPY
jgi:xeroderma pigmentosum group C-complementing protein